MMVRGCITRNGVGKLVVVDGNIDAVKFCNIIDKNISLLVKQCFGDQHHPDFPRMIMQVHIQQDMQ